MKTEQRKDKREIGVYDNRLEKSCTFKNRVININTTIHFFVENKEDHINVERRQKGQARKSARGMPWHWEPKKDVANCDKPRGAVNKRYIRGFPNGATRTDSYLCNVY